MERTDLLRQRGIVALLACISCLLWGSAAPAIKTGYELMSIRSSDVNTIILFAGCRFTLAGIMVIAFSWIRCRGPVVPSKHSWGNIIKIGLFQTVGQYVFNFIGVAHTSSVNASILNGTGTLFAIVCACILLKDEHMTRRKLIGCILGFGGLLVTNIGGKTGSVSFMGEGFMIIGAVCGAISSSQLKVYSRKESAVTITGYQFLIGGMIMLILGLALGGKLMLNPMAVLVIVYLGVVSAVAYTLWNVLINRNDVSTVSVYGFTTPIFGVLLSAVFMGEMEKALSLKTLIALVLVCLGVLTVSMKRNTETH